MERVGREGPPLTWGQPPLGTSELTGILLGEEATVVQMEEAMQGAAQTKHGRNLPE